MASKRALRRASCEGKIRHATPGEARAHALHMREQTQNNAYGFYKCQFCGGWHVGRRNRDMIRSAMAHATNRRLLRRFRRMLREETC